MMAVFGTHEENHQEDQEAPKVNGEAGGQAQGDGGAKQEDDDQESHDEKAKDEKHDAESHDSDGDHSGESVGRDHADGHHDVDWSSMVGRKDHLLSTEHLLHHVMDDYGFEIPTGDARHPAKFPSKPINIFGYDKDTPLVAAPAGLEKFVGPTTLIPTKFMALEVIAAVLIAAVFIPYARRVRNGDRPQGRLWQLIDVVVCYIKEQVAEPAIGKSDAKRFLPLVWSLFFFILFLNLFGMIPGVGAATGSISVTSALALIVFGTVVFTGSRKMGVIGFWKAQVPHMDLPFGLGYILVPMIWLIEVFGLFVKHVVLAVRLFANMFAGHLVMAVFAAFLGVIGYYAAGLVVGPASLALSMLELMVAFIQAYVFAFLAALFIGAAVHPH